MLYGSTSRKLLQVEFGFKAREAIRLIQDRTFLTSPRTFTCLWAAPLPACCFLCNNTRRPPRFFCLSLALFFFRNTTWLSHTPDITLASCRQPNSPSGIRLNGPMGHSLFLKTTQRMITMIISRECKPEFAELYGTSKSGARTDILTRYASVGAVLTIGFSHEYPVLKIHASHRLCRRCGSHHRCWMEITHL